MHGGVTGKAGDSLPMSIASDDPDTTGDPQLCQVGDLPLEVIETRNVQLRP